MKPTSMKIQQQLEYNWERGYFSKVVNKCVGIGIVSTKRKDGIFRFSTFCDDIKEAKSNIGASSLEYYSLDGWEIVGTIHPSELMGKGFQVGDKVKIDLKGDGCNGMNGTIELVINDGVLFNVRVQTGLLLEHISPQDLKPVLPVEEDSVERLCNFCKKERKPTKKSLSESNFWIQWCCDEWYMVSKLKEKGIIKDGKIVNL